MTDAQPEEAVTSRPAQLRGQLSKSELFWRDNYNWLLEQGYKLRSRYAPEWTPSWEGTKKLYFRCSDGIYSHHASVLDAQRASDGELVYLKCVNKTLHPHEAEIGRYFSTGDLASDPRNHCVPVYEVLQPPDNQELLLLVMPLLKYHDVPPFDTIGEAVDFFQQIFEGLQFMHENNVAHRDVTYYNILMDARSIPKHHTRTLSPVKYYLADFGLSRKYSREDRPPMEDVIVGGDKTVPEFETTDTCDPFPTDVYTLGNLIRQRYTEGSQFARRKRGFDFLNLLVADMTHPDPSKRPTMDEVVVRFQGIRKGLSGWKLRSRVASADELCMLNTTHTPLENINGTTATTVQPNTTLFPGSVQQVVNSTMFIVITDADPFVTPYNLSAMNDHIIAGPAVYIAG
ncbi:hypothetical protein ONZ45_g14367 [Pleurotus djamor]|nr:hypothetical protein ONZ45_g14367 [Pleurotus djamor]